MCNKCNQQNCNCKLSQFPVVCDPCLTNKYCTEKMDTDCVYYHLDNPNEISKLTCIGIPSNTPLSIILEEFDKRLCGLETTFDLLVEDTNTVNMTITNVGNVYTIKSDVKYADSNSIDFSDSINGLSADIRIDPASNLPISIGLNGINFSSCKQIGDFKEVIGTNVVFAGNGTLGSSYSLSIYETGIGFIGTTTTYTELALDTNNSNIIFNCSAFVSSFTAGKNLEFRAKTLCGTKSSDLSSKNIIIKRDCPQLDFGFQYNNIQNDIITINYMGGSSNPDPLIISAEYEMKVNGVVSNIGVISIENGNSETKVKSNIPLQTGDAVQFRYRSICSCCDSVTPTSGWSTWNGTNITIIPPIVGPSDPCDTTGWLPIPSNLLQNNWLPGTQYGSIFWAGLNGGIPEYRIKNKVLELRGTVYKQNPNLAFSDSTNTSGSLEHYIGENILDLSLLSSCITYSNTKNTNYGIKDSYSGLYGNYSYSSLTPNARHMDTVTLHATLMNSIIVVAFYLRGIMEDNNVNLTLLFPVSNIDRNLYISLENIKIEIQ